MVQNKNQGQQGQQDARQQNTAEQTKKQTREPVADEEQRGSSRKGDKNATQSRKDNPGRKQ